MSCCFCCSLLSPLLLLAIYFVALALARYVCHLCHCVMTSERARDDHFVSHFSTIIEMHFCLLSRTSNNILTSCFCSYKDGHDNLIHSQMCVTHAPMDRNCFVYRPRSPPPILISLARIVGLPLLMFMFAECMIKTRVIKWIFMATR